MKQEKNIWKEFEGKTNTDEVLIQKARMLAPILVYTAVEDTKLLFEKLKEDEPHRVSEDKFDDVCLEIILFNIHLSDRFAFMCLASKKRNTFIDNLFLEVRENLSRECKSGIDAEYFRNTFAETYNIRQLEYGKCEIMLPEKDEGVRDTLSWEFGKKIAGVLGFEMDVFIITYVSSLVVSSAEIFDLPSLFRGSNS